MASTFQKIADKLTGKNKEEHDDTYGSNYGSHSTNTTDPSVGSGPHGSNNPASHTGGYGHTQTGGAYGTAGGTNIGGTHSTAGNPAFTEDHRSTNTEPHNSNLANKLDPRVDTDRDGRSNPTSHTGGYAGTQSAGTYGGNTIGNTQSSNTTAPHNSNLLNKLDPRVDSDMDGRNTVGSGHTGRAPVHDQTTSHTGIGHTGVGHTGSGHTGGYNTSSSAGPHNSNVANKLDPRVDSDYDGRSNATSHTGGYGSTHTSGTGTTRQGMYTGTNVGTHTGAHTGTSTYTTGGNNYDNQSTNTSGPHSSNLLNKLDPRVDNDKDSRTNPTSHTGGYGQTQSSTGYAGSNTHGYDSGTGIGGTHESTGHQGYTGSNVAHDNSRSTGTAPHSSNLLNKLDPRVNEGRDNSTSNTGGYDQTHTGSGGVGRY